MQKSQLNRALSLLGVMLCLGFLVAAISVPFFPFQKLINIGKFFRYDYLLLGALSYLFWVFTFTRQSTIQKNILTIAGLFLVSNFAWIALWGMFIHENNIFSGFLPMNIGNVYFSDILRLISGLKTSYLSRPMFISFSSFLFILSGENLQIFHFLYICIFVAAAFFLIHAAQKLKLTPPALALMPVLLFFFYRDFIGKVMTENLALPLGMLGCAYMIQHFTEGKRLSYFVGLAFITAGLFVRPGPMLVLPLLALGFLMIQKEKLSLNSIFLFSIALGFPVLLQTLSQSIMPADGMPFSNYAYSLYGLAKGGAGWNYIFRENPVIFDFTKMSTSDMYKPEIVGWVWSQAFDVIKNNPWALLRGVLAQYPYLIRPESGLFSFIYDHSFRTIGIQLLLFLNLFAGIFLGWRSGDKFAKLFVFSLLGFLLSVPLMPFTDVDAMRASASYVPLLIMFSVSAFNLWLSKVCALEAHVEPDQTPKSLNRIHLQNIFAVILALPFIFFVFIVKPSPGVQPADSCPPGSELVIARYATGAVLRVTGSADAAQKPHTIPWNEYQNAVRFYPPSETRDQYISLEPEFTLIPAVDALTGQDMMIFSKALLPLRDTTHILKICGSWMPGVWLRTYAPILMANAIY